MKMKSSFKYFCVHLFFVLFINTARAWRDLVLFENVLDPVQCEIQLEYIRNNGTLLRLQFLDASGRIPRNILGGNLVDLGSYFECLNINEDVLSMNLEGKYCLVQFPFEQDGLFPDITLPEGTLPGGELFSQTRQLEFPWNEMNLRTSTYTKEFKDKIIEYERLNSALHRLIGAPDNTSPVRAPEMDPSTLFSLRLAFCIPKACTHKQALDSFTNNVIQNLTTTEQFCRLPNDKSWVAADTIAVVIFSVIGLITILSTAYDFRHTILLKKDPKNAHKLYQSFSVYTNTKNFFVFPSSRSVVTCLDGIRSFAMLWVIIGHTFVSQLMSVPENPLDLYEFMRQLTSIWITSGPITVDTFFTMSGLLLVYTTAAKVSRMALVKSIHLFYLNRILRMFPILALGVLLTASFLHRLADGPNFTVVGSFATNCRANWWSTLLYVQNFVHPEDMCLAQSWYLAIDMQLHIFSPIVLFFVLGQSKKSAWIALVTVLVAFVTAASIFNFVRNFQSASIAFSRVDDLLDYNFNYYVNPLTRAAPFFVGMIFGYLLHLYRDRRPNLSMSLVLVFWVLTIGFSTSVLITPYWNIQPDWDNQLMDNLLNSFMRPIWATCIGWLIFACHNGYGGPVNWFLSLPMFKVLGRLSYAMYILHYPLIFLVTATELKPVYFAVNYTIYRFLTDFSMTAFVAFIATIGIDFPFANLIKMAIGPGPKKPPQIEGPTVTNDNGLDSVNVWDGKKNTQL